MAAFLTEMGLTMDDLKADENLVDKIVAYHTVLGITAGEQKGSPAAFWLGSLLNKFMKKRQLSPSLAWHVVRTSLCSASCRPVQVCGSMR